MDSDTQADNGPKPEDLDVTQKVIGIFTSPHKVFESIKEKPDWLLPFILMAIVSLVVGYLVTDIAIEDQIARIEANPDISPERAEMIIEGIESGSTGARKYINLILSPVIILVVLFLVSGILLFCGNVVLGGDSQYKKVLAVYAWSGLISVLAGIVKTPLILLTKTTNVATNLAVFFPFENQYSLGYRILSQVDVFTIWLVIVIAIGLSVIYRFRLQKTLIVVATLQVIWAAIKIGFSSLLGGMFG